MNSNDSLKIKYAYHLHLHIHHLPENSKLTPSSTICLVTMTNQHRYETHNNHRMTLEKVKANQVIIRTKINTIQEKMDQLLETMLEIAQRERERAAEMKACAKRIASQAATSGLVNQNDTFAHAKEVSVHIPVGNEGHIEISDASAQHGSKMA